MKTVGWNPEWMTLSWILRLGFILNIGHTLPIPSQDSQSCVDPSYPYTWMSRNGNNITMGCTNADHRWTLYCQAGVWRGEMGHCFGPDDITGRPRFEASHGDETYVNKEMAKTINNGFYVNLAIAVAVLLCLIILIVHVIYRVCRKEKIYEPSPTSSDKTFTYRKQYSTTSFNGPPQRYPPDNGYLHPTAEMIGPLPPHTPDRASQSGSFRFYPSASLGRGCSIEGRGCSIEEHDNEHTYSLPQPPLAQTPLPQTPLPCTPLPQTPLA